jgi:hypothetical protein
MNIELYESKINILYNYLNDYNLQDNYEIDKININKISLRDIELAEGKDSNEILSYLLKQTLQFLFIIDDDIYFKILSNNISTIMKISLSNEKLVLNDNFISYVLSELVLRKKTNNILLPIVNLNVNLLDLQPLLKSINNLPLIYENYFDKNKKKIISVQIREGFYNLTTLRHHIDTSNNINYKLLLFYIINTLETIKLSYKYFNHNNLSLDNIFIYNKDSLSENEIVFNGITYTLPNDTYEIKITNFEQSQITNINIDLLKNNNEKELNNNDLLLLAKDILKINKNIDLETKNFLTKLRDMKNNNIKSLNDDYFSEYVKKSSNEKSTSYTGSRKIDTAFNFNINSDAESVLGNQKLVRRINTSKSENNKKSTLAKGERQEKSTLIGGGEKSSVPPFKKEQNNPFRTNDERTTFNKKKEDENIQRTPPVLLEQTIYDTHVTKPTNPPPPPVYVPVYDHNNQQMAVPFASHIINPSLSQPVIKQYNVSLANPLHDFRTVSSVNEDILPGDPRTFTFTTVYERKQLINFIRNLINTNTDGEDMIITGGKNSLLSSMKLLDLNPYTISSKPHLDLAKNFLLFRAAYPIRYNEEKKNIQISKTAHGINVRIYNLSIGEMIGNELHENLDNFDFDMWRELKYYKYILDNIIEKKISPNFISYILTKKDKLSNVNWSKLDTIQNRKKEIEFDKTKVALIKNNVSNTNALIKLFYITNGIGDKELKNIKDKLIFYSNIKVIEMGPIHSEYLDIITKFNITSFPNIIFKVNDEFLKYDGTILIDNIIKFINTSITVLDSLIDLRKSSGESLVLLTEAPHSNIIRWTSPMYESSGALRSMIATGFHKSEVWESVLFQMMHIFYTLQENNIYMEELSLENNIYIKDLYYDSNNLNYWIYNIDGLDYYVPNYGYLVLFDSKYNDLESGNYKIQSSKLYPDKNDKIDKKNDTTYVFDYNKKIYDKFKSIYEPSIFNGKLKKQGGLEPANDILDLVEKIHNDTISTDIKYFIKEYFKKYLNNRIGQPLNRTEKENVNPLNTRTYKKGELLVYQERFDDYKWVLFDSNSAFSPLLKNIIIKDTITNTIKTITCNNFNLSVYPSSEKIKPYGIEENKIIETYKL